MCSAPKAGAVISHNHVQQKRSVVSVRANVRTAEEVMIDSTFDRLTSRTVTSHRLPSRTSYSPLSSTDRRLVDHLILTQDSYVSLRERNKSLFEK